MEKPVEKVIGWVYCMIDPEKMAAVDIYEGNYIKLMEGGVIRRTAARKQDYDRAVALYEECVKNDEMISTAYEQNQKLGLAFHVPEVTADPTAAEREWEIRKNPQTLILEEEPKKRRFFGIRPGKKRTAAVRCPACGKDNLEGQKFCGFCKAPLIEEGEGVPGSSQAGTKSQRAAAVKGGSNVGEDKEESGGIPFLEEEGQADAGGQGSVVKGGRRQGGRRFFWKAVPFLVICLFLLAGAGVILWGRPKEVLYDWGTQPPAAQGTSEGYVAVKLLADLPANTQITEDDIEGVILSADQFEKYNRTGTYIDEAGQMKSETLLMWEERDEIIGRYTARELLKGSLLYDTSITSQHVVANRTYVEVEVDGEGKSYQADAKVLPGNTRIQIVAVIQTDAEEPKQVLLSELALKDRALESIFDSAGQDILDMLSGAPGSQEEENGAANGKEEEKNASEMEEEE